MDEMLNLAKSLLNDFSNLMTGFFNAAGGEDSAIYVFGGLLALIIGIFIIRSILYTILIFAAIALFFAGFVYISNGKIDVEALKNTISGATEKTTSEAKETLQ